MNKSLLTIFIIILFLIPFVNADIIINEIMYDFAGADTNHEWIELYNNGSETVNLTGWKFYEANTNHGLTLGQGNMLILPSEYVVIVQDNETFLNDHVNYDGKVIDSSFSLSNSGEYLAIKNSSLAIVDDVFYSSNWGGNSNISLESINPNSNNNLSSNWNSSLIEGGTPGQQNSLYDNISPVIYLTFPANNTFFNKKNINFTFNFTDNTNSCNCSLYLNNILNQSNGTTLNNTSTVFEVFNINETSNIEWNITCVDNSLNENSSVRVFTIDLTYPEISNITDQVTTTTATINWTTSENTNSSIFYGPNLNLTSNLTNATLDTEHEFQLQGLNSNTLYYYNITSCDQASNCNNSGSTYNFTTNVITTSSTTTTTSGSSSSSEINTFVIDITSKNTLIMKEDDVTDFNLNGEKHEIKISEVKSNSVVLVISSEPLTIEIKVGETKEVDLDNDNKVDIKITLLRISINKEVRISFEEIKGALIEEIEELTKKEREEKTYFHYNKSVDSSLITGGVVSYLNERINFNGILITIMVVVIGLIVYFRLLRSKRQVG